MKKAYSFLDIFIYILLVCCILLVFGRVIICVDKNENYNFNNSKRELVVSNNNEQNDVSNNRRKTAFQKNDERAKYLFKWLLLLCCVKLFSELY